MMDIDVHELKHKLDTGEDFVFIDVREVHEYEEFNLGAKLMPMSNFANLMPELEPYKVSEVVVHCRSGARSAAIKNILESNGFTKVRNLIGGVLDWQRNFPY